MFNSINELWEAAYDENIVGKKVSAELVSEFECYDGHSYLFEDDEGVWIEINKDNTIIDTGCLGM